MKKFLLALILVLSSLSTIHAAKAWPYPITVTQSDGTTITVYLHGDENFHWYTDVQGNILKRDGNDFTKLDVAPETYVAQGRQRAQTRAASREPIAPSGSLFPFTGTPRAVVILAQYPDRKFTVANPRKSFDQYLNATEGHPVNLGLREDLNYGSVKQYFMAQSDGAYAPQFDVYGPITLPQNMAYYGGTADDGSGEKYVQLVIDACTAMNDSLDFSSYDQNGDGKIDLVYVIYAGYGQSNGAPNYTMWPKSFGASTTTNSFDGKGLSRCGISNELNGYEGAFGYNTTTANPTQNFDTAVKYINGIGLFCHEFSHCLGLPDFYPSKLDGVYDNQGMEDWSVMDNGCYLMNGYCPRAYTVWEREAMGWDNIKAISTAGQYKLTDANGQRAVKVVNPGNSSEYYVLELFEDKGWNQRMARYTENNVSYNPTTSGLLIYHVDYNSSDFSLVNNNVNNVAGHPKMTVIPADGRLVSSYRTGESVTADQRVTIQEYCQSVNADIFRVDSYVNYPSFSQTGGLVNAAWWTSAAATPIYNINYTNGAVYFDFLTSVATTGIEPAVTTTPSNDKIYTLDGRYVGTSTDGLPRGIYIRGGKKFVK